VNPFVGLGLLAWLASLAAGCRTPGETAVPEARPAGVAAEGSPPATSNAAPARLRELRPPSDVLPAHFQATVYEVQADAERLGSLQGEGLAKSAATAEGLLKALGAFGTARILYRFDQPVNVFSESLQVGTREPVVTGTRMTSSGQSINSVQYHSVGAIIRLAGRIPPPETKRKRPEVTLAVELSVLSGTGTEIAPGLKAPSIRNVSMQHGEELEFGRPRVMLAVSSTSTEPKQPAAIYVFRYVFKR
jgi:hypothetical protein